MAEHQQPARVHGTAVAWNQRAVLMIGPSNSGKSALALQLMALGCSLVADDQVGLERAGDMVFAKAGGPISGLIEARGVGLLNAAYVSQCPLSLVIDMGQTETDRLPPERHITYLGAMFPLLHKSARAHFPESILQYLKAGRRH